MEESKSSYEKINYSLRPAKAIERKMFCEIFHKLAHFQNIESYRYVGFGSTYFSDFSLFHRILGITDLISIEKDTENSGRFDFNRPYACISTIFEHSNDALPTLKWDTPTILWLDYDYKIESSMLTDISTFFYLAKPASMFMITIDIKADEPKDEKLSTKDLKKYRIDKLTERIGRDKLPFNIHNRNLGVKGNISTIHSIISDQIKEILLTRNGIISNPDDKLRYQQIINIYYNDGTPMLTLGGILFKNNQQEIVKQAKFNEFEFSKSGKESFDIEVPSLTFKEIFTLDSLLPDHFDHSNGELNPQEKEKSKLPNLRKEDIVKYAKVYRYFPTFAETNF